MLPSAVLAHQPRSNHASFQDYQHFERPPGHDIVESHVGAGFGLLFSSQRDAEDYLGRQVTPAPLGCVTKAKPNGELKHRVILDLRANKVNASAETPERQVLPTVHSHAMDMALLGSDLLSGGSEHRMWNMVLDFRDAFMGVPLARSEWGFNCCALDLDVARGRAPLYDNEPASGRFVLWCVLGFGGKPNPLVFSRAVSFASRTAQGLIRPRAAARGPQNFAPGRLQMYVDDPLLCMVGPTAQCMATADAIIAWWLVLGLPLSWSKGLMSETQHRWIGADFSTRLVAGQPAGVISVPPPFADELFAMLLPLAAGSGHVSESFLDKVLGKAGRLSYLVPASRPYVACLWSALAATKTASAQSRREAPPNRVPAKRFASAAQWLRVLLRPPGTTSQLPLEQLVVADLPRISLEGPTVHVDASLWGGGGVLFENGRPVEYWVLSWSCDLARLLQTQIGDTSGQTTWEYLAIFVSLLVWGSRFRTEGLAILGDNLASLSGALNLKGRSSLTLITKEISWRKVREGWRYACGHLPSEHNLIADALSRQSAPLPASQKQFPQALRDASEQRCPDLLQIWCL